MNRRELITLAGGAAAWPVLTRAQQAKMPVIGYLSGASPESYRQFTAAFHEGLKELGYIEGQNIAIEYRWAEGRFERLPALAAELVDRRVSVIAATGGTVSGIAAKAVTSTIPIVFMSGSDPISSGLVGSFNRPGYNLTGVNLITSALDAKRIELLNELVRPVAIIGLLLNSKGSNTDTVISNSQAAARSLSIQLDLLKVVAKDDLNSAFENFQRNSVGAIAVAYDPLFTSLRGELTELAAHYKLPTIYGGREYCEAGGLISYGTSLAEMYRLVGSYVGKILRGASPGDLPVQQPTKFELVINLKTAKALGLTVPQTLLVAATEVIE